MSRQAKAFLSVHQRIIKELAHHQTAGREHKALMLSSSQSVHNPFVDVSHA